MNKYTFAKNKNGTVKVTKIVDKRKINLGWSIGLNQALIETADDFEPGTVVDLSKISELITWTDSEHLYLYACPFRHIKTWIPTYGIMGNN